MDVRPADLDIERLLRGEMGMVCLHRSNNGIDRAPPKRMHGRGPGTIDMAEQWIVRLEVEHAPVLEAERDLASGDLGGLALFLKQGDSACADGTIALRFTGKKIKIVRVPLERSSQESTRLQHGVRAVIPASSGVSRHGSGGRITPDRS